jgi:hypothetical protein
LKYKGAKPYQLEQQRDMGRTMSNFTLKGILYGRKIQDSRIPVAQQGMTAEISCITCGKTFKRWSILSSSTTVCDECMSEPRTSH